MRSYQLPMLIEIKPCIILGRIDCRLASHASVGRIQVLPDSVAEPRAVHCSDMG